MPIQKLKLSDVRGMLHHTSAKSSITWGELVSVLHSNLTLPDIRRVTLHPDDDGVSVQGLAQYARAYAKEHGLAYRVVCEKKAAVLVIPTK